MFGYASDFDLNQTLALLSDFSRRMDRLLVDSDPFRTAFDRSRDGEPRSGAPRIALRDDGTKVTVVALVPGVEDKDLKVSLHDDLLTLTIEREISTPDGYEVRRRERAGFQLSRTVALGAKVDPDKASAELKDGVLTLTLEKAAEARPRQISIKAS